MSMIMILGAPGAGKTRLAGTFPSPLFFDVEGGAKTAVKGGGVRRIDIPTDANTLKMLKAHIQKLDKLPYSDGALQADSGPIQTVVIDSIDSVQQSVIDFNMLSGNKTRMRQQDWGDILTLVRPLGSMMRTLSRDREDGKSIHVVCIAHTKITEGEGTKPSTRELALQGSLRTQFPMLFDVIIQIAELPDGVRAAVTIPTIWLGSKWMAKDRHGVLKTLWDGTSDGVFKYHLDEEGYPPLSIAEAMTSV